MKSEIIFDNLAFQKYRYRYYERKPIYEEEVAHRVFKGKVSSHHSYPELVFERFEAIQRFKGTSPELVIVTATKNRPHGLIKLFESLKNQKNFDNWMWLVIHNDDRFTAGTDLPDNCDPRRIDLRFVENTGSAYPVRNFGLDIIHLAFSRSGHQPRIMPVDDDDYFYNAYSLHELFKIGQAMALRRYPVGLFHGITIMDEPFSLDGKQIITEPHDISSKFGVGNLSKVFDKGIISTSGTFPIDYLNWLRYPPEKSFEDNGLNHKLLLNSRKIGEPWVGDVFPVIFRGFDPSGLTAKNSISNAPENRSEIGLYALTGLKAVMVRRIKSLTDSFISEKL